MIRPTETEPHYATDGPLVDGLLAVGNALAHITKSSLTQVDPAVTMTQFATLMMLAEQGPRRVADIAAELAVQSSTATRMCDRLIRKDFIARQERLDDRRVSWISLTPTGHEFIDRVHHTRRTQIAAFAAASHIPDLDRFATTLQTIAAAAPRPSRARAAAPHAH